MDYRELCAELSTKLAFAEENLQKNIEDSEQYKSLQSELARVQEELDVERANNAEFKATYQAKCDSNDELKELATKLLKAFDEGVEKNHDPKASQEIARSILKDRPKAEEQIKPE